MRIKWRLYLHIVFISFANCFAYTKPRIILKRSPSVIYVCFRFVFILMASAGWSCNNEEIINSDINVFFSFNKYFSSQAKELRDRKISLKKTVSKATNTEEHIIDPVNWENEFKIFMDADLNKKSWIGLYKTDSVKNGTDVILQYTAADSSLQVKTASVVFAGNDVKEIIIESRFKNFYYQSSLLMHYNPEKGYQVKGEQVIRFGSMQTFEINAIFLDSSAGLPAHQ